MKHKHRKAIEVIVARTILGGCLLLFGMNQFHGLLGNPELTPEGIAFLQAMKQTGYLYYVVKGIEFVCGILLIGGLFVPLANLVVFPVVVNIFLFHVFLSFQGFVVAMIMAACSITIFWQYREMFKSLLRYNANIHPNATNDEDVVPDFQKSSKESHQW